MDLNCFKVWTSGKVVITSGSQTEIIEYMNNYFKKEYSVFYAEYFFDEFCINFTHKGKVKKYLMSLCEEK